MKTKFLFILVLLTLCVFTLYALAQDIKKDKSEIIIPEFKKSTQIFEQNYRTWEVALEDLDSDGDMDAVFTSLGPATQILFNDGKGNFKKSDQKFPEGIHGIAIGDIDLDGDNDLFFAPLGKNQPSPTYLNNGQGFFERSNPKLSIEGSEIVRLIDIDNDGDLDAHVLWRNMIYLNDSKGNFSRSDLILPMIPFFSDLNGDNAIDIICLNMREGFKVYLNDKKGNFNEYCFFQKNDLVFSYLGFADIDNDGDKDVIFSNGNDKVKHPAGILLNDGTGKLTDSKQMLSQVAYGYIGTGDLNNDDFIDIIITDRENPSEIWLNNGKGKFINSGIKLGKGGDWNNCIIKDVDNDGDMDVFITKVYQESHGLWFNQLIPNKNR